MGEEKLKIKEVSLITLTEDAESGGLKVFPRLAHSRIT